MSDIMNKILNNSSSIPERTISRGCFLQDPVKDAQGPISEGGGMGGQDTVCAMLWNDSRASNPGYFLGGQELTLAYFFRYCAKYLIFITKI